MKKIRQIILLAIILTVVLYAGQVILEGPTARNAGDSIVLQWKSGDETNVREYQILRSAGQGASFIQIASVSPKGNNSVYEYVDRSVFKSEASLYYYRVVILFNDNSRVQTPIISVSFLSSTAKRTWGSIKAMFR